MKRILVGLVVALLIPGAAMAAEFRAGEDQLRITDQVINDNLYAGAGSVTIDSQVNGDAFITGGQVDVEGNIADDLFIGAGNIRVPGDVGGDVRIGGGNVRIEGNIAGELLVGGGSVEIAEGASISGDVLIAAGQFIVAGTTGPIRAQAGDVRIASTATINGNLEYISHNEARIEEGAVVTGETIHRLPPPQDRQPLFAALAGGSVLWLITSLVMLMLFIYALPVKSQALAESWKQSFGFNLLYGFIFLIVAPIAAFVLLLSIIGIPLGIGAFLLYPILLYIGKLAGTVAIGSWIRSLFDKEAGIKADWISAVAGLAVLIIIGLVPVAGAIVVILTFLAGLGALVRYDWNLIRDLYTTKKI